MNEYRLRQEIERLKTENGHLEQKLKDAEDYANFKRDFHNAIRSWRWWLKVAPFGAAFALVMFWEDITGRSRTRWWWNDDSTVTMTIEAFGAMLLLPLLSVTTHLGILRYRQWRRSRGELQ